MHPSRPRREGFFFVWKAHEGAPASASSPLPFGTVSVLPSAGVIALLSRRAAAGARLFRRSAHAATGDGGTAPCAEGPSLRGLRRKSVLPPGPIAASAGATRLDPTTTGRVECCGFAWPASRFASPDVAARLPFIAERAGWLAQGPSTRIQFKMKGCSEMNALGFPCASHWIRDRVRDGRKGGSAVESRLGS